MNYNFINRRKFISKIIVLALVVGMLIPTGCIATQNNFNDIKGHWAEKTITEWLEKGYVKGYPDGTFKPNEPITRAEFITLTNRVIFFSGTGEVNFRDVRQKDWFYKDLQIAVNKYIIGFPDNTFRANRIVSREQAASIAARINELADDKEAAKKFYDYRDISDWAKGYVGAAVSANLMQGFPENMFLPKHSLTRAQAVVVLQNLMNSRNYTITEPGTTLANMTITGDLIVEASVGDSDVYLENVTVKGITRIFGGGINSIYFNNCQLNNVYVDKKNSQVRIVFEGNTSSNTVKLLSQTILELKDNTTTKNLQIDIKALQSIIKLSKNTKIDEITINANQIQILGNGTITVITNYGTNNKTEITPSQLKGNLDGIEIIPSEPIPVTGVEIDKSTAEVIVGETVALIAIVEPTDATNKSVQWSSSDSTIATVDNNGLVSAISAGTVTITVTTIDGSKTDSCAVTVNKKPPILATNIKVTGSTRDAGVTPPTDKGGYFVELEFTDGTKMKDLSILEVKLYKDSNNLVTNSMAFNRIDENTKNSSIVTSPFNLGTIEVNLWSWNRGAFPVPDPLDDSVVPNKAVINFTKDNIDYTFTKELLLRLPAQHPETLLSKEITNFNYETIYATQAKIISKAISTSNFGSGNNKEFTIDDGLGNVIPVNLNWDIPLNESATTYAAAVGSAVESIIQDYFYQKGGEEGLVNRTLCAGAISTASGYGDEFYISTFATGSNSKVIISGTDAYYFFDTLQVNGTDEDKSLNREFTISDGTNTATMYLDQNYEDMESFVYYLNSILYMLQVKVTAEKVDSSHFKLVANELGIKITIGGQDKSDFFN